jgi:hypothetical protein
MDIENLTTIQQCVVEDVASTLIIKNSEFEQTFPGVVCGIEETLFEIPLTDLEEGTYQVTLRINEPCLTCQSSKHIHIEKENLEINIPDNNLLVLLALIGMVSFILIRKEKN